MKKITIILLLFIALTTSGQGGFLFNQHQKEYNLLFTFSTTSISTEWTVFVIKYGSNLKWISSGAVADTVFGTDVVFDFSTVGTKNVSVYSSDGTGGLREVIFENDKVTAFDFSSCDRLEYIYTNLSLMTSVSYTQLPSSLDKIYMQRGSLISANFSSMSSLQTIYLFNNQNLTSINITGVDNLNYLVVEDCKLSTINVSGKSNLFSIQADDQNTTVSSINISGCINLTEVSLQNDNISQTLVDYVLCTLSSLGSSFGQLFMQGNTAPSATGIACQLDLESDGWYIETD